MEDDLKHFDKTQRVPSQSFNSLIRRADHIPPSLILMIGPSQLIGRQWVLDDGEHTLGRSVNADIHIHDNSLSRDHARLIVTEGKVSIEDLGSTNGTLIEGIGLLSQQTSALTDNDYIQAGNVIFKFMEEGNIDSAASRYSFERGQRDALTGIYNKRAFLESIPIAFTRAQVTNQPLGLIVFDLDRFKDLNDSHGHQVGDMALQHVTERVKRQLRPGDIFARYGGEEFVCILAGTPLTEALDIAERIRLAVSNQPLQIDGKSLNVSLSAGVAEHRADMPNWQALFEASDLALYEAKNAGRNCCSSTQEPKA